MRHNEPTVVEDVVADEPIQELLDLGSKLRGLLFELEQRAIESVGHGDVAALQLPLQLDVVVARDTQRGSGLRHRHHCLERVDDARAAVHEVADEDRFSACRVCPRAAVVPRVAELL